MAEVTASAFVRLPSSMASGEIYKEVTTTRDSNEQCNECEENKSQLQPLKVVVISGVAFIRRLCED
jgi:hypothetical protein